MAAERTFSILKPDATARNLTGAVNAVIEKAGLRIVAQKRSLAQVRPGTIIGILLRFRLNRAGDLFFRILLLRRGK